ncbi:MAG: hypothetical protein IIC55_11135, partial [Proteobacteria bacterium]|nr:hypothetical protein [Pseudomonadota bacterium]
QSRGDYIIYAVVVIVIAIGTWNLDWWQEPVDEQAIKIRSLVVLPLDNLMNDPEQTYFVSGMHEALITELSKIETQQMRLIDRIKERLPAIRVDGKSLADHIKRPEVTVEDVQTWL